MTTEREPSEDDMQAVFKELHAAGWPGTLAELRLASTRLTLVTRIARNRANGSRGVELRPDLSGPITNPRPAAPTAAPRQRAGGVLIPTHPPAAVDLKRIASGDRDD